MCHATYKFILEVLTIGADIKRDKIPPQKSAPNYPIHDQNLIAKVTEKFLHHIKLGQISGSY